MTDGYTIPEADPKWCVVVQGIVYSLAGSTYGSVRVVRAIALKEHGVANYADHDVIERTWEARDPQGNLLDSSLIVRRSDPLYVSQRRLP